jgi:hypothetical protein
MTYDEAVAAFQNKFSHVVEDGIHTNATIDEWGNEFIAVYANNKNAKAGIPASPLKSDTAQEAFDKWLEAALDSVPGGMVTLYWRVMPTIHTHPGREGVFAFSRMSFSANPPKPKQVTNPEALPNSEPVSKPAPRKRRSNKK